MRVRYASNAPSSDISAKHIHPPWGRPTSSFARELGFTEQEIKQMEKDPSPEGILRVIYELVYNICNHALDGYIFMRNIASEGNPVIRITAIDVGIGITEADYRREYFDQETYQTTKTVSINIINTRNSPAVYSLPDGNKIILNCAIISLKTESKEFKKPHILSEKASDMLESVLKNPYKKTLWELHKKINKYNEPYQGGGLYREYTDENGITRGQARDVILRSGERIILRALSEAGETKEEIITAMRNLLTHRYYAIQEFAQAAIKELGKNNSTTLYSFALPVALPLVAVPVIGGIIGFISTHPAWVSVLIGAGVIGLGIGLFFAIWRYCFPKSWYLRQLRNSNTSFNEKLIAKNYIRLAGIPEGKSENRYLLDKLKASGDIRVYEVLLYIDYPETKPLIQRLKENNMPIENMIKHSLPVVIKATKENRELVKPSIDLGKRLADIGILPCSTLEYGVPLASQISNNNTALFKDNLNSLEYLAIELNKEKINPYKVLKEAEGLLSKIN
ncbi:hypothetical protein ACFL4C_03010, partial [Candidatus Omnitrophota bacterium]